MTALPGGYEALGVERDGEIVGGALYSNFTQCPGGGDIMMWAAGHGWLSRRIVREFLGYPFRIGCHRITVLIAKGNKPSRTLVEKLGFKLEGVAREGFSPRQHACIYGLLRREAARWL